MADGSPWLLGPISPLLSPAPHPSVPSARTVARAAPTARPGRARMRKDGTWKHFVGIDVAKDRLDVHVRPCGESFTVARDGKALAALVERLRSAGAGAGRDGGDRRLRDRRGERARRGAAAAGGGQPAPDPRLRPRHRQTGQDRPARCRGNRPFRRGDPAAGPARSPTPRRRLSASWSRAAARSSR